MATLLVEKTGRESTQIGGDQTMRPIREDIREGGHPDPDLWDESPGETRPAPNGFDYGKLPEPLRSHAHDTATAIHQLLGPRLVVRSAQEVVEVGLALKTLREPLGEQLFERWLAAEFQWQPNGASKLIRSATVFQGIDCIEKLQPKAVYLLSRRVVPPTALAHALELARAGKRITRSRAAWILRVYGDVSVDIDAARMALLALERAVQRITLASPGDSPAAIDRLALRLVAVLRQVYFLRCLCIAIEQGQNSSFDPENRAGAPATGEHPDAAPPASFAIVTPAIPPESVGVSSTQRPIQ
jgi:hypothetical protein